MLIVSQPEVMVPPRHLKLERSVDMSASQKMASPHLLSIVHLGALIPWMGSISLGSPGYPRTLCGLGWPQTDRNLPASASKMLEFKACTASPSNWLNSLHYLYNLNFPTACKYHSYHFTKKWRLPFTEVNSAAQCCIWETARAKTLISPP